jgi:hypothetical protein
LFVLAFAILAGGGLGGLSMLAINLYHAWARRRRGRRPQRKQITPIFDELIGGVIGGVAAGLVIGFLGGLAFNPRVFAGGAAEPFSPWINPIAWALAFPTGAILIPFGTLFSWFEGSRRALLRAVWVALLIAVPITLFVGLIAVILAGLLGLFFGNLLSYRNPPLVIATGAALLGALAGSVEGFHIGSILCAYRNRASLFAYRQRP